MNIRSQGIKLALVAVLASISAWSSRGAATVDDPVVTSRRYVAAKWCSLGTSITWYNSNVGASGGRFTKGYQTRVMEQIKFDGLANVGVNGGCISSAVGAVVPADLYTIEHGINDWGHSTKPGTLEDYVKNTGNGTFAATYRKLIDKIRETNPKAKIILCTPRKGYGFGGYLPERCDLPKNGIYLKDYVAVVRAIAKKEKLPVADFYGTCGEQDELIDLSIEVALHPNDAGYQKMANELVKTMLKVYPKAPELAKMPVKFTDDGKPKTVTKDGYLGTTEQTILKGVNLAKVTVLGGEMGGNWIPGAPYACEVAFQKYDAKAKKLTCQLQVRPDTATRSIKLEFAQDGSDVTVKILWARYSWNWPVGTDFEQEGYAGNVGIAASNTVPGYGIGKLILGINKTK